MVISTHELAWAAGFFDGEGNTAFRKKSCNSEASGDLRYKQIGVDVRQADRRVLDRFAAAVGVGNVYGPYVSPNDGPNARPKWAYIASSFENVQALHAMLWKWLGPVKRAQAVKALIEFRNQPRRRAMRKTYAVNA